MIASVPTRTRLRARLLQPHRVLGPLVVAALAVGVSAVMQVALDVQATGSINLMASAVASVIGGVVGGLLTGALTFVYATVVLAGPDGPFTYDANGLSRLTLLAVMTPVVAVLVGGLKDRADRVAAEASLRRLDETRRIVTQVVPDAIVTIDKGSRIQFANDAVERLFGRTRAELLGQPLTVLMPERFRDRHLAALRRYLDSGQRTVSWSGVELVGLTADGTEFPIEVSFADFLVDGQRSFTGAIRDISERRRLEGQLGQSARLEAVGQLAGGIAHDFNNVLTAVRGYAQLLDDELPADSPMRPWSSGIAEASTHAADLVRQLLAFSRQQNLRPVSLDLGDVIEAVLPLLRRLIREDVDIRWHRATGLHATEADPSQLEQVIVNLAVNARDAMPEGGVLTIEASNVELEAAYAQSHPEVQPGRYVLLAVSDTGVGMDAATRERVFEPFFTTKEVGHGTGLGLATVHGIVRQTGGHIWVYSEPGEGTTFKVYLPSSNRVVVPAVAAPPRPPPVAVPGARILVVEDEGLLRQFIRTVLEGHGYQVSVVDDGVAAVDAVDAAPFDLVLCDVVLPGMRGRDVATEVRARRPATRVVFMSGYTGGMVEQQSLIDAGDPLLDKPFGPDDLLAAVSAGLRVD